MYLILLSVLVPILTGICFLTRKEFSDRKRLLTAVGADLILTGALVTAALVMARGESHTLFYLTKKLPVEFKIDEISVLFSMTALVVLLCGGFFSFAYMDHEHREKRYYGFYLIVFGVLNGLCFAGNLITFYLFFEMLTLSSMPLVLHSQSKEAVMAGLKYLFYSLCGAYMALFGIYFIFQSSDTLTFTPGGILQLSESASTAALRLSDSASAGIPQLSGGVSAELLLIVAFIMILGFGVKAGMFPMHAWLPAAHPVAPAPASAVLSAVIVKAGVLALVRVIYYIFGPDFLRGTWVQTTWLVLTLVTVFMGSLLAYREPLLKKRLAYSTVSQLSYILFGLAVAEPWSVTGSLLHVTAHAMIKATLFLCAGAIIYTTGKTRVDELKGIGKKMPLTMWCYTIVSLGLIGIPPTGGFVSKWYLATGSLASHIPVFRWLGPVILLVSALLTAGYLLPLTIRGFFPGADYYTAKDEAPESGISSADLKGRRPEASLFMTIPIVIMTIFSVLLGLFPGAIIDRLMLLISPIL